MITVKELLDTLYSSCCYNKVIFTEVGSGLPCVGSITCNDVWNKEYGKFEQRIVKKFGFYNENVLVCLEKE